MSRRGHTLYELMVSLALIAALSGFAAVLVSDASANDRTTQAGETQLRHVRQASDLLAAGIRGAAHIEWADGTLVTDGTLWTVHDGDLLRAGEPVVRGIERLTVESTAPRVWTVALVTREGDMPPATLLTTTRQRVETAR